MVWMLVSKETKRWKKSWATSETSRECPWCGITQTVTIIPGKNKVAFAYCPYCGNPVSDGVEEEGGQDDVEIIPAELPKEEKK